MTSTYIDVYARHTVVILRSVCMHCVYFGWKVLARWRRGGWGVSDNRIYRALHVLASISIQMCVAGEGCPLPDVVDTGDPPEVIRVATPVVFGWWGINHVGINYIVSWHVEEHFHHS